MDILKVFIQTENHSRCWRAHGKFNRDCKNVVVTALPLAVFMPKMAVFLSQNTTFCNTYHAIFWTPKHFFMAQSEGQNNQLTGSMTGVLNPSLGPQALQSPPSAHHSQSLDRELKMLDDFVPH